MTIKRKEHQSKRTIDISGPQGNAFFLLGKAQNLAKQLEYSEEEIDALLKEMKSGDYENLLKVFDDQFGEIVDLVR